MECFTTDALYYQLLPYHATTITLTTAHLHLHENNCIINIVFQIYSIQITEPQTKKNNQPLSCLMSQVLQILNLIVNLEAAIYIIL